MRKILIFSFLLLALSITSVSAQDASPSAYPIRNRDRERINEMELKREELQNRIELRQQELEAKKERLMARNQEKKATMEAKLLQIRKTQVTKLFGITYKRYMAAITRLEKLIVRINSRLAIYKSNNPDVDVTDIETQIASATTMLAEAKTALEAVKTNLPTVLESDTPKESFSVLKEELGAVKEQLKEVHSILVHVIGDIKGLRVGNTYNSTTPQPAGGEI